MIKFLKIVFNRINSTQHYQKHTKFRPSRNSQNGFCLISSIEIVVDWDDRLKWSVKYYSMNSLLFYSIDWSLKNQLISVYILSYSSFRWFRKCSKGTDMISNLYWFLIKIENVSKVRKVALVRQLFNDIAWLLLLF